MYGESTQLGLIADFEMGQSPESSAVNDSGHGTPFLQGSAEFGRVNPRHKLFCIRPRKLCRPGDVLISVRAPVGDLNKADKAYCIGRGLAAVRFHSVHPAFGWHMLNYWSPGLRRVAQGSTFEAIGKAELRNLKVVVPPRSEQHRIAEILDTIDDAIQATEALIAKLRRARAGLLHDLLTRGIDEHGHLRDPDAHPEQFKGSPLGRIPREWRVIRMDALCSNIVDCPHTTPVIEPEGVLMARTSEIRDGMFNTAAAPRVSWKNYRSRITRLEPSPGDIVFTREAPVGEAFIIPDGMQLCLGQRTMLLRPDRTKVNGDYLIAQVYSGAVRGRIEQMVAGTTNPHLNVADVRAFVVPTPDTTEQLLISNILDTHDARVRSEIAYRDKLHLSKRGLMDDLLSDRVRAYDLAAVEIAK